ncbi:ferritin family protein [Brevibacillus massiliensis]|uniref:ferritin family protein n=1 Tax=Brevibacillus massiliensis TaxID=1118054 RepID=UPI0013760017|nr:ferritin-like domain-containing protein [Brevibacillus massiliensis]
MYDQRQYYNLLQQLQKAIQGEYEAIRYYEQLAKLAPPDHRRYIEQIGGDERLEHIVSFSNLYRRLTGQEPQVVPGALPTEYVSGLKKAFDDEQEAADFYQKVYLGTNDPHVRNIFFEAMTDEMRHATTIAFLYSNYFLEDGRV